MPIVIDNQQSLHEAREAVKFCYICGNRLRLDSDGRLESCSDEHVLPISILRLGAGVDHQDRFPVILDVHERCDRHIKSKNDNIIAAFNAMHNIPVEQWGDRRPQQIRTLMLDTIRDQWGNLLPAVSATPLLEACREWVRGFHAVLYKTFVPPRPELFSIFPPTPSFNRGAVDNVQIQDQTQFWNSIRGFVDQVVDQARNADQLDTVQAWGGELAFEAVWLDFVPSQFRNHMRATCFWNLRHPGLEAVAGDVPGGVPRWSGMYCYFDAPDNAVNVSEFMNQ